MASPDWARIPPSQAKLNTNRQVPIPPIYTCPFSDLVTRARQWADETNMRVAQANGRRRHRDEIHQQVTPQENALNGLVSACIKAWRKTGFTAKEVEKRVQALAKPTKALLLWELKAPRPVSEDPDLEEKVEAVSIYLCEQRGKLEVAVSAVLALADAAHANHEVGGQGKTRPPLGIAEPPEYSDGMIGWLDQEWERRQNRNGDLAELYSIPGVSLLQAVALLWWREHLSPRRVKDLVRELAFCAGGSDADWRNIPIDQAAAILWARRDVTPPRNPGKIDPTEYRKALEIIHNKTPLSPPHDDVEIPKENSPTSSPAPRPTEQTPSTPLVADVKVSPDCGSVDSVASGNGQIALPNSKRMTLEEANQKAMKLAAKWRGGFFALSERKQAEMIGCSWQTWVKTTFYKKAQNKRPTGKRTTMSSPKTESLTTAREAVTGEGDKDEILNALAAEQEADKEQSPLSNRAGKVHSRKRL